jgi:glycosyltransferase involved in cell wall biosynthesis
MRVTHCPVNTAGIPWTNVQALRGRGVDARLVVFNRYRLHPEADIDLARNGGLVRQQLTQWRAFARLAPETDIFHFYFGLTLVPKSMQFALLRALGKRSVMHFLGSDIRGKPPEALAWTKRAGARVVGSYDAVRWVPDAQVIPPAIDVRAIEPALPSSRPRPLVVAACATLDVDLEIVEGLDHRKAFELYRRADIIVDQLNAGWYGVFAIEAMALGKPVVTFLHDEAVQRTEDAFGIPVPIVSATKDNLAERLRPLVESAAERERVGRASRAYAEEVHDLERMTDRLLALYAELQ